MSAGQYEILREYITPDVRELIRGRLLDGMKFFGTTALREGLYRDEVKLALLLIRIANPTEVFTSQEKALMDGPMRGPRQQKDNGSSGVPGDGSETEIKATKPKRRKRGVSSAQ